MTLLVLRECFHKVDFFLVTVRKYTHAHAHAHINTNTPRTHTNTNAHAPHCQGLDPVSSALGNDSIVLGSSGTFWLFASMGPIMAFFAWLFVNITCWWDILIFYRIFVRVSDWLFHIHTCTHLSFLGGLVTFAATSRSCWYQYCSGSRVLLWFLSATYAKDCP